MSKHETPMVLRYWEEVKGTLIEEFLAVPKSPTCGKRLIDAVILPELAPEAGGERRHNGVRPG